MAGSMKRQHAESGHMAALSDYRGRKTESSTTSQDACGSPVEDRVHSPKNVLDLNSHVFGTAPRDRQRALSFHHKREKHDWEHDEDAEKRVTIWNWRDQRKLSGNSAPFKKNLKEYIRKHPDWEEYVGQDKDSNGKKLSQKKAKAPEMEMSPPASPRVRNSTGAYGTRSANTSRPGKAKQQWLEMNEASRASELNKPMPLILESNTEVARRRAQEVAARRKTLADAAEQTQSAEPEASVGAGDQQQQAAEAWQRAVEAVSKARIEKAAAARKLAEDLVTARRSEHAVMQCSVAEAAFSRMQASKRRRMVH